eukprot:TRINITY_DN183_c0_g1_i1.p1 TRINITY_DN183_c0_g1~~TRINITY_DN183_c0_g1_i1.p1  ORF type:complete len:117 (-),score=29.80 TRINITY_DN183_c0_g1_i1:237-587(-)
MVLLDPDPFLNELNKLYERNRRSGSVWVTMTRTSGRAKGSKKRKVAAMEAEEEVDLRCLIRATDGKKKISTLVSPSEQLRFQTSYGTVLKAHMDALKKIKRDKKDRKKTATTKPSA